MENNMSKDNGNIFSNADILIGLLKGDILYKGDVLHSNPEPIINEFIEGGVNVSAQDANGDSVLGLAMRNIKDTASTNRLIEAGANPNIGLSDISPLSMAAESGDVRLVKLLLDHKANINGNGIEKGKPLLEALQRNNSAVAKLLISKGADISDPRFIDIAVKKGNLELLKLLITKDTNLGEVLTLSLHHNKSISQYLLQQNDLSLVQDLFTEINYPYSDFIKIAQQQDPVEDVFNILNHLPYSPTRINQDPTKISMIADLIDTIIPGNPKGLILKYYNGKTAVHYLNLFKIKHTFKYGKFILSTHTKGNESSKYEAEDINENSRTEIKNGKFYQKSTGALLDSEKTIVKTEEGEEGHYVVDKNGDLFVNINGYTMCHSHFLPGSKDKTKLGNISLYGYGKRVACGGHLKFEGGLIIEITNGSGHYAPITKQLLLVCKHFYDQKLLAPDVRILAYSPKSSNGTSFKEISLETIIALDTDAILSQFPSLLGETEPEY